MTSIADSQAKMVERLEARAKALEGKADELHAIPKLFSLKRKEVEEQNQAQFANLEAKHSQRYESLDTMKERLDHIPKLISLNRRQVEALEANSSVKDERLRQLHEHVSQEFPSLQTEVAELDARVVEIARVFDVKIAEMEAESIQMEKAIETKINEMDQRYGRMGDEFQTKVSRLGTMLDAGSAELAGLKGLTGLAAQVVTLQKQQKEQQQKQEEQLQQLQKELQAVQPQKDASPLPRKPVGCLGLAKSKTG